MVNKKGYIRTLEAVIAIVLLLFATYALTPKPLLDPRETPYVIESAQEYIATKVTEDNTIRQNIINYGETPESINLANETLTAVVQNRLPAGYDFSLAICDNPSCITLPELQTSVYMSDVIVAGQTSLPEVDTRTVIRLVRVWFWRL
ncbi:MAG: hypothetical protein V1914_04050 [archaeon]